MKPSLLHILFIGVAGALFAASRAMFNLRMAREAASARQAQIDAENRVHREII